MTYRGKKASAKPTFAAQPQISDCDLNLSNHRHAVKDYFPIIVIFVLTTGFAPSSATYYTRRRMVSRRGESSW
jgi:hypothetical protein